MKRRQVRPANQTSDLPGGQADTLRKAPTGNRHLNPLEPNYFYPGGAENINTLNDMYGEKTCSMSAANFKTATNFGSKALKEADATSAAGAENSKCAGSQKAPSEAGTQQSKKSARP